MCLQTTEAGNVLVYTHKQDPQVGGSILVIRAFGKNEISDKVGNKRVCDGRFSSVSFVDIMHVLAIIADLR